MSVGIPIGHSRAQQCRALLSACVGRSHLMALTSFCLASSMAVSSGLTCRSKANVSRFDLQEHSQVQASGLGKARRIV